MRRSPLLLLMALALGTTVQARAMDPPTHHTACAYTSDYDMRIEADGVAFTRDNGTPASVFIHGGGLRVDGRDIAVSKQDAAHLREYEQDVRDLVPAVASITRDGVDMGYSALTTVAATLAQDGDERTRLLRSLRARHAEALRHIDDTLGRGRWKVGDGGEWFDADLQKTVADVVSEVTLDAVSDALSGDAGRLASLQARTDALDTGIDKAVDAPADRLAERAQALCPRLGRLQQLQQQLQVRLADGERLQLISANTDRADKASQYAQR